MLKAIKKFFAADIPVNEQAVIAEIHNEFDLDKVDAVLKACKKYFPDYYPTNVNQQT